MCAGALTAVTAGAGEIAMGACDVVLAGGVEHMGHHPMGAEVDFNPRFVAERLIDESSAVMGATAENLHDGFPHLTRETRTHSPSRRSGRPRRPGTNGVMRRDRRPDVRVHGRGWTVAARDEFLGRRRPWRAWRPSPRRFAPAAG